MKIQKILQQTTKPNFGAGVTKLYTDFDGTYIPDRFTHDSVCNSIPPVNKEDFKSYFDKIWTLFGALKGNGEESKFNFVVTTGRNIAETNYYLDKLRSQDLWVPLPEKLVTCNGQDEYFLNVKDEEEFFKGDKPAFVKENVNQEKREYYKSMGWDYAKIKNQLKEILSKRQYQHKIKFQDRMQDFNSAMFEQLSTTKRSREDLLNEIETKHLDEAAIRKLLDETSTKEVSPAEKPYHDWYMGELAHILYQETTRRHEIIDNVPTTRSRKEYGANLSLQTALENIGLAKDDDYMAFSDDGELGIRIAVSKKYEDNIKPYISKKANLPTFTELIKGRYEVSKLKKGSYAGREFEIRPSDIDKSEDTKKIVDEMINSNSNDLLIVAGDGSNDCKMLDLSIYTYHSICPETQKHADRIINLPVISIYIDNRTDEERADITSKISKMIEYSSQYNFDGNIRFIHVDPKDPEKPHTMEEAMKLAIASYAKRNPEFKKNLSSDIQKMVENYRISYPIDLEQGKKILAHFSPEMFEKKFINKRIMELDAQIDRLFDYEQRYQLEDAEKMALDTNSEMADNRRSFILNMLASTLLTYNALLKKVGEEKSLSAIKQYLDVSQARIEKLKTEIKEETSEYWLKRNQKRLQKMEVIRGKFIYLIKDKNLLNIPQDIPAFIQKCKETRGNVEIKTDEHKGPNPTPPKENDIEIKTDTTKKDDPKIKIDEHKKPDIGGKHDKGKTKWQIKKEKIAEIIESLKKHIVSKTGLTIIAALFTGLTVLAVTKCRSQQTLKQQNNIENMVSNNKVNY